MSLAVSGAFAVLRPDLTRGAAFLFSDEAVNLFVADALHRGHRLFTEVAYPYGPVAIRLYQFVSALAGNTPVVYLWTLALVSAGSAALIAWAVSRSLGGIHRLAVLVLWVIPTVPIPGATVGGYTSSIYMPLERVLLLVSALLWVAPPRRGTMRGLAIGAVLGVCQGVRFGTGIVMLVAVFLADVVWTRTRGAQEENITGLFRALARVAVGFLAVETAWVIWALTTLPRDYALEFLWPLQMWEAHRVAIGVPRWPTWGGWKMALSQYLLPVMLAGLAVVAARRWMKRTEPADREGTSAPGILLLIFYGLGAVVFFRHEHHFRQFVWTLVPAAAAGLALLRPRARHVVLLLSAMALWPAVSALTHRPPPDRVWLTTPKGFRLMVRPDTVRRVQFLEQARAEGPVLFAPNGSGWLYAYGVLHVSRHAWFYSRSVVRPFEEERVTRDAAGASRVILCDDGGPGGQLPEAVANVIEEQSREIAVFEGCRMRRFR